MRINYSGKHVYINEVLSTNSSNFDTDKQLKIIKFTAFNQDLRNNFAFRSWTYIIIEVKLDSANQENKVYANIEYNVSLIDRV